MSEAWRPIPGYEGLYEASNQGRVRSVPRVTVDVLGRARPFPSKTLRATERKDGRLAVTLSRRGVVRHRLVHQLVLEAFVGPCPDGMEALHFDDVPSNNALANLRWDTHENNMVDRTRNSLHHNAAKTHCAQGHEFTPANTWTNKRRNARVCRACRNQVQSNRRAKVRNAAG